MEQDDHRLRPQNSGKKFFWKIGLAQFCLPNTDRELLCLDHNQRKKRNTEVQLKTSKDQDRGVWISSSSREAKLLVVSPPPGEDVEYSSSSNLTVILGGRTHERHRVSDLAIAWPQVEDTGQQNTGGRGSRVLLASYWKVIKTDQNLKIVRNDRKLRCKFAMQFGTVTEAEACFRVIQMLATEEAELRPTSLDNSRVYCSHNSRVTYQDIHRTETGLEFYAAEKGDPRLSSFHICAENPVPECLSRASHQDQYEIMQSFSQEEPRCCTQFSELTSLSSLKRKMRGDLDCPVRQGQSTGIKSVSKGVLEFREVVSNPDAAGGDGKEENLTNLAVNLDSSSQLWSPYSSLSSQTSQEKLSPNSSDKNPRTRKKLYTVPILVDDYTNRASEKTAATGTTMIVSQGAARESLSNQEEIIRAIESENVLRNDGAETNPQQSSSPFSLVDGPPRFSQLLTQASQSKPRPGINTIQISNCGIGKRKSKALYPRQSSEATCSVQDDDQGAPLGETKLREQIMACLLEPNFEDFVAEVEKVWDELEHSIPDDVEWQGLKKRLKKDAGYGPSQYGPE